MAFFNYATMQMAAKIVYYGPGLCGKTTNLQYIYNKTSPKSRGEMVSLETEADRTLFFDLLPLEVGVIAGFKTRFQLYTVPGQVFYGETRRMVLKGVDGIVFVADSQVPMRDANMESLKDLDKNLKEMGLELKDVPMVFQFNKRDLANILPVDLLQKDLNPDGRPAFESSAVNGSGVFDTLKGISRLTLQSLKTKLVKPTESVVAKPIEPAARPPQAASAGPVAAVPIPPPMDAVEFATLMTQASDSELARTAPKVKTVATTSHKVSQELDRIRESLLAPLLAPTRPKMKDLAPALDQLKKAAESTARETDMLVQVPPGMAEGGNLRLEVVVTGAKGKGVVRQALELDEAARGGAEGWVVKLRVSPKKA